MTSDPLTRFRKLCQPGPLRGDEAQALAVDRDDLDEEFRPDLTIRRALLDPVIDNPKVLLFGSRGCGKSTELARVEQRLREQFLVVGLDVGGNAMIKADLLRPEELLLLAGLAIASAAEQVWGYRPAADLEAMRSAIKPMLPEKLSGKIDLGTLARSLVLFGTTILDPSGVGAAVVKNLTELTRDVARFEYDVGGLLQPQASNTPALDLLMAVNELIRRVEAHGGRKPLLLIDDLDKIDDAELSFTLLTEHDLLSRIACPMVIVGPSVLQQESKQLRLQNSFHEIVLLYHVRCRQMSAPERPDPVGVEKLRELVNRRVRRVTEGELLSRPAEDLIIASCGGAVRDLVRLLEMSAAEAQFKGRPRVEIEHANSAVRKLRRRFETYLSSEDLDTLRETRAHGRLPRLDGVALRLLNDNRILAYSNGKEWYYPHSILVPLLDDLNAPPAQS